MRRQTGETTLQAPTTFEGIQDLERNKIARLPAVVVSVDSGYPWDPNIVDELTAPGMLLPYSLQALRRGRYDVRAFMRGIREAFRDLGFGGAPDLFAKGVTTSSGNSYRSDKNREAPTGTRMVYGSLDVI